MSFQFPGWQITYILTHFRLKHFAHPLLQEFRKEYLEPNFHLVHYIKPESSRSDSAEGYWLCRGWLGMTSEA